MTIERLRSLEKEWRKESDDFERDGDEGTASAYYNCAEQLSAILADLGQEMAPVAWLIRDRKTKVVWMDENSHFGSESEATICAMDMNEEIDDADFEAFAVYASPAHTSEARDCPAQFFASGPQGDFFTADSKFANHLILVAGYDRDDWTVTDLYAAMRQEAE